MNCPHGLPLWICLKPECISQSLGFTSPILHDPNFQQPEPEIKENFLPGHYSIDYIDNIFGRTYFLLQHIEIENKQELMAAATWDQMGEPLS